MNKIVFLTIISLTQFVNASIIQIHQPKDQNLNQINTEFFVSSFMGRKTFKTQGELNPFTFEVDTIEQTARSGLLSFNYNPIEQQWEKRQAAQKLVNNPFPNPPTIINFDIVERISITGLFANGSFSPTNFTDIQDFQFPIALNEIDSQFSLSGVYSISSYEFNVEVPFFYTVVENPINTKGLLRMDETGLQVEESYYILSPSSRMLYNGTVEGYGILAQLNPVSVPVTVPEPSTWVLLTIIGLGLFFFIRDTFYDIL